MKKFIIKSSAIVLSIFAIYLLIGLALIFWPSHLPKQSTSASNNNSPILLASDNLKYVMMRDNQRIATYHHGSSEKIKFILLHGVAATHKNMAWLAEHLSNPFNAEVISIDWRGHGLSDGRAYDVNYIGQYEDDLEDLIKFIKSESPDAKVILVGHSMGGGIAMRYVFKSQHLQPDGYILLAPNMGEGQTQKIAKDENTNQFVKFNFKRMIGQIMLNVVGINWLDHLPILSFTFDHEAKTYSYRAVLSSQPIRPFTADIALSKLNKPLAVLIGAEDEVFDVEGFKQLIPSNPNSELYIIEGESHVSILKSKQAVTMIEHWFSQTFTTTCCKKVKGKL